MARGDVPVYESEQRVPVGPQETLRVVNPPVADYSGIGEALAEFGKAGVAFQAKLVAGRAETDEATIQTEYLKRTAEHTEKYSLDPDFRTAPGGFSAAQDKLESELAARISDPQRRAQMGLFFARNRAGSEKHVKQEARKNEGDYNLSQFNIREQDYMKRAMNGTSDLEVRAALDEHARDLDKQVKAGWMHYTAAEKKKLDLTQSTDTLKVNAAMNVNVDQAIKDLDNPEKWPSLDPKQRATLMEQAKAKKNDVDQARISAIAVAGQPGRASMIVGRTTTVEEGDVVFNGMTKVTPPGTAAGQSSKLRPGEQSILDYHRETKRTGTGGKDEQGRDVTVFANTIEVPEGPNKGKFVTVPGWFDGKQHRDEGELWAKWKDEVDAGKWPLYDTGKEGDTRAKIIHDAIDREGKTGQKQSAVGGRQLYDPISSSRLVGFPFGTSQSMGKGRHVGVDLAAPAGTPVHSPMGGTIYKVGGTDNWNTEAITVKHDDGTYTRFLHVKDIDPKFQKTGARIEGGEVIAKSGTANKFDHLHFERFSVPPNDRMEGVIDPTVEFGWGGRNLGGRPARAIVGGQTVEGTEAAAAIGPFERAADRETWRDHYTHYDRRIYPALAAFKVGRGSPDDPKADAWEAAAKAKYGEEYSPQNFLEMVPDKETKEWIKKVAQQMGVRPGEDTNLSPVGTYKAASHVTVANEQAEAKYKQQVKDFAAVLRTDANDPVPGVQAGYKTDPHLWEANKLAQQRAAEAGSDEARKQYVRMVMEDDLAPFRAERRQQRTSDQEDYVARSAARLRTLDHVEPFEKMKHDVAVAVLEETKRLRDTDVITLSENYGFVVPVKIDPKNITGDDTKAGLMMRNVQARNGVAHYGGKQIALKTEELKEFKRQFETAENSSQQFGILKTLADTLDGQVYKDTVQAVVGDMKNAQIAGRIARYDERTAEMILRGTKILALPNNQAEAEVLRQVAGAKMPTLLFPNEDYNRQVLEAAQAHYAAKNNIGQQLFKPTKADDFGASIDAVAGKVLTRNGLPFPLAPNIPEGAFLDGMDKFDVQDLARAGGAQSYEMRVYTPQEIAKNAVLRAFAPGSPIYYVGMPDTSPGSQGWRPVLRDDGQPMKIDARNIVARADERGFKERAARPSPLAPPTTMKRIRELEIKAQEEATPP